MDPAEAGANESTALRPGMVVGGKFVLLRRLGEGGVGVVFEAEDTWIGRRVAIKVLHAHLADRTDVAARFRREARATAMIHHPNIVSVYEVGQRHDKSYFIVQELIEGESLRELVEARRRLTPAEAFEILVPIMGALSAAHRSGIVHRDIKPENILLTRSAEGSVVPKLIDFGVAKMAAGTDHQTLTGSLIGTPAYMSPEQASGAMEADARTDIWSLGAVMYELLSGHIPYEGATSAVILARILSEPAPPIASRNADLPAEVAAIVHRAMERDPAARFASMADFLAAVLDAAGKGAAGKPDPSLSTRHARSIPPPGAPGEASTDVGPPPPFDQADTVPPSEAASLGPRNASEWARPMAQPELGWYQDGISPRAPRNAEWYAAAAGNALRVNALDEAIDHAEHAIVTCRAPGELRAQMRLVQAIAFRWLGHYADSERCALEAVEGLPPASTGWYAALGHLAIVGGYLGKNEHFPMMIAELARLEAKGQVGAPHVVTACRLAISLVRAGLTDRASEVLASARREADPEAEEEPVVRAWIDVAGSEFAVHAGDPTGYLTRLEAAVVGFAEAGDARNACLQRANIGNAYMQLGAYARAKALLREALSVGEPMKLSFIAPVRANLGFALARLNDLEQALEIERAAFEQCVQASYRRFEVASRIYLAVIFTLRGELGRAEIEVRAALETAGSSPPIRAYALAVFADVKMAQRQPEHALVATEEAFEILNELEGVEEGEALIRVVHAEALEATGDPDGARARIAEARLRLLERADRITDSRLRRSFLDHIPENARTLSMAARLKRGSTPAS
jgi:eukaryotic-like serine/threonine-protein kinase